MAGDRIIARAIATRCRCPPENMCGYRATCSGRKPTVRIISAIFSPRSARPSDVLMASGSSSACPTVLRGLSDAYGFWNTICTRVRSGATSPADADVVSVASTTSLPDVGGSINVKTLASVDLPHPDSPTTASVRPAASSNDTPLSALSVAGPRSNPRFTV